MEGGLANQIQAIPQEDLEFLNNILTEARHSNVPNPSTEQFEEQSEPSPSKRLRADSFDYQNDEDDINVTLVDKELRALTLRLNTVFSIQKTPIQILNELYPTGNNIKITDKGSFGQPHDPLHITCVEIHNIGTFLGKARSKQDSKQQAARKAVDFLQYLKQSVGGEGYGNGKRSKTKRVKTALLPPTPMQQFPMENPPTAMPTELVTQPPSQASHSMAPATPPGVPCDMENENYLTTSIEMESVKEDDPTVLDSNLSKLIFTAIMQKWESKFNPLELSNLINRSIPDEASREMYGKQDLWRYKEIAGFVLVSDLDQTAQVLSLATGTKCIGSQHLSLDGDVLHDCHAEILARRGFNCVLYEQLQLLLDNNLEDKPEFILELAEDRKGFRLKKHLKLHLYISSPPCGDARIFNFSVTKKDRNRASRGILRVKLNNGQGAIPWPLNYVATWDAILTSAERCVFMCCSDKVALWNAVGVQGSLLSYFIEPIYIESLVVSNFYRHEHLKRALYGRINQELFNSKLEQDSNFKVNEHKLGVHQQFTAADSNPSFIPPFSHNWNSTIHPPDDDIELIRTETGSNYFDNQRSRLCKQAFVERFKKLTTSHEDIPCIIPYKIKEETAEEIASEDAATSAEAAEAEQILPNIIKNTYRGLKNSSLLYQKAKIAFFQTLKETNYGTWVKAPVDIDMFDINE